MSQTLPRVFLSYSLSSFLRRRMCFGVTSTSSSSLMKLHGLLEAETNLRSKEDVLVRPGGANVCQLLGFSSG